MGLHTSLNKVEPGNRESLLAALSDMSYFDADFNGENGLEYLWDDVWVENDFEDYEDYEEKIESLDTEDDDYEEIILKYTSNLQWLLDEVKDIKDDKECVKDFFSYWLGQKDGNYYLEYEANYITNEDGKVIAVSIAVVSPY